MALADLLVDFVEAEHHGDQQCFRVPAKAGQGRVCADRAAAIRERVHDVVPSRRLDDLELAPVPRRIVTELIEEQKRAEPLCSSR